MHLQGGSHYGLTICTTGAHGVVGCLRNATRCQNTCRRIPHIETYRAYRSIWQWAKPQLSSVPFQARTGRSPMLLRPPIAWPREWIIRAGAPSKVRLLEGRSALCARFSFHRRCTVASGLHTSAIGTLGLPARAKGSGSGSLVVGTTGGELRAVSSFRRASSSRLTS